MQIDTRWSEYAEVLEYEPGEYVFKEGDPGNELYLVISGQVAIIKDAEGSAPLVLSYCTADQIFGEVSLLQYGPRTASAMAVEKTRLIGISRKEFWDLFHDKPVFREMIFQTVVNLLLNADESRKQSAAEERDLFERLGSLASEHDQLAEIVNLRQETMRFIVHDLRNPLNLIMMALSMIEADDAYNQNAESRRFLALAIGGVKRMYSLTESLLDVERLESGIASLHVNLIDMRSIVDGIVEEHRPLAWASQIELESRHVCADLPLVMGDTERLERVLNNLIGNALKFTRADGMVTVVTWEEGGQVFVAVDDQGPGIPADQRSRVFDRFVQLDDNRKGTRGFGLGLAYCRSAIQAHGGVIRVEDTPYGEGSRFVFSLPVSKPYR
ncbi:MAG: cyclic nucleotide-binding domain-containing protein [Anaerolineae bacterium]|nr:cyclic nucleotide-binding domain-containing protein [Anaerolineae bacterium]